MSDTKDTTKSDKDENAAGSRFFMDERVGCIAVRDMKHPKYEKDYPGLHHDTPDVIFYAHGIKNNDGWFVDERYKRKANEVLRHLQSIEKAYADYRLRFEQGQKAQPLDPFEGAPEWAEWRAADMDGREFWHNRRPSIARNTYWSSGTNAICPDRRLTYSDWRQSPVKRKR